MSGRYYTYTGRAFKQSRNPPALYGQSRTLPQVTIMKRSERLSTLKTNIQRTAVRSPGGWVTFAHDKNNGMSVRGRLSDNGSLELSYDDDGSTLGSNPGTPIWSKLELLSQFAKLGGAKPGETTKSLFTEALMAVHVEDLHRIAITEQEPTTIGQNGHTRRCNEEDNPGPIRALHNGNRVLLSIILVPIALAMLLHLWPDAVNSITWIPAGRFRTSNATQFIDEVLTSHENALAYARDFLHGDQ